MRGRGWTFVYNESLLTINLMAGNGAPSRIRNSWFIYHDDLCLGDHVCILLLLFQLLLLPI